MSELSEEQTSSKKTNNHNPPQEIHNYKSTIYLTIGLIIILLFYSIILSRPELENLNDWWITYFKLLDKFISTSLKVFQYNPFLH